MKQDHLSGVNCSVNTCKHFMQGNFCSAEGIDIEPKDAQSFEQTDCSTFMQK